jgi:hypothetical protein
MYIDGTSRTFTLTITDAYGRTTSCNTVATGATTYLIEEEPPQQYVSLSQIPYTGFDFGPLGNTLYWLGLAGFALAASYLVIYGGMLATMGRVLAPVNAIALPRMRTPQAFAKAAQAPVAEPKILSEVIIPKVEAVVERIAPVLASVDFLPTTQSAPMRATRDTMTFAQGGAPRIIINRS